MKKLWTLVLVAALCSASCTAGNRKESPAAQSDQTEGKVIKMDKAMFLTHVFNYEKEEEWKYLGDKPAIIDLYADWCGPCRQIAPIMDKLAKEYAGKIVIYKVNVDRERELSAFFSVKSIPLFVLIPKEGAPRLINGAAPEEDYRKAIDEFLLKP